MSMHDLTRDEHGQTMAEYAVVLGVITPIIVFTVAMLSESVAAVITEIAGVLAP